MAANPLHTILAPKSVGIVGASNNPMKMGTMQCLNIMTSDYPGEILPVHPTEKQVFGVTAYNAIEDLPYAPEVAMLVVPTRFVNEMLDRFGAIGTRFAIIISAGFKETGEDGQVLEKDLLAIAGKHGIRFLGPNCMGVMNASYPFNATVTPFQDSPGGLSLASQSGTYLAQTLGYLKDRGVRLQKGVSVGNEANIDLVDCLEYLGEDPETRAIGLYIESLRDADRFLDAAKKISKQKPILAQYVGGTKAGARSGASHTGALAGPDFIYDGLFEQAGIIRVSSIEEVYRVGNALAACPPLEGKRIGVLTHSGGPGTAMSDMCDRQGLVVQPLPEETKRKIREIIPPHASANNPVDLTFIMDGEMLTKKVPEILFACEEIDGVLLHGAMDTGWAVQVHPMLKKLFDISFEQVADSFTANMDPLVEMPGKFNKPLICSSFMGTEDHALNALHEHNIPAFDGPEKAAFAMGCLYKHLKIRNREEDRFEEGGVPEEAKKIVEAAGSGPLDEHTAKRLFAAYGIPVVPEVAAKTLEEATVAAEKMGYPVAVKILDPAITHKTEQGLVKLNLNDEAALASAYEDFMAKVPGSPVLVSKMMPAQREFMAGMIRHPGFGPIVLFGLGGVLAEALKDRACRVAPFGIPEARRQMASLRSADLLGPWRGMPEVDQDALAKILMALGQMSLDFPHIQEADINPILIADGKPMAADALVVLKKE